MTTVLVIAAVVVAVLDWVAVARALVTIERIAKPLTLALLLAAAVSADLGDVKPWVVAALAFGLVGDTALLFAKDQGIDGPLLLGLAAFLGGHVCYLVGFTRHGVHPLQIAAGVLVVGGAAALTMPTVIKSVLRSDGQELASIVGAYAITLSAMAVLGVGTSAVLVAIGALAFVASDSVLAWERFVGPVRRGPLIVIVTYHAAQVLILLGLLRH